MTSSRDPKDRDELLRRLTEQGECEVTHHWLKLNYATAGFLEAWLAERWSYYRVLTHNVRYSYLISVGGGTPAESPELTPEEVDREEAN